MRRESERAYEGPEGKRGNLSGGGERVKAKDVTKPPLIQNRNWIEWLGLVPCVARLEQKILLVCKSSTQLFKLLRRRGEIITKCSHCGAVGKNALPSDPIPHSAAAKTFETIRFRLRIASFERTPSCRVVTTTTLLLWFSYTYVLPTIPVRNILRLSRHYKWRVRFANSFFTLQWKQ